MKARIPKHLIAWALVASISTLSIAVRANSTADAESQFRVGVALQRVDDFEGAILAYQASLALQPTRSALFNLANCLRAAHRYPEAQRAFEDLLGQYSAELEPEMRSAAEAELSALEQLIGSVSVEATPEGAEVRIDGHAVGRSPLSAPLKLAVGPHDLEVVLDGYQSQRKRLDVTPKAVLSEQLKLVRVVPPAPPPRRPGPLNSPRERPPHSELAEPGPAQTTETLGWVATALGGALVLGGATTGAWALALDASLDGDCPRGHCPARRADDISRLETLATASNVLLGTGGALAIVGITVLASTPSQRGSAADAAAIQLDWGDNLMGGKIRGTF